MIVLIQNQSDQMIWMRALSYISCLFGSDKSQGDCLVRQQRFESTLHALNISLCKSSMSLGSSLDRSFMKSAKNKTCGFTTFFIFKIYLQILQSLGLLGGQSEEKNFLLDSSNSDILINNAAIMLQLILADSTFYVQFSESLLLIFQEIIAKKWQISKTTARPEIPRSWTIAGSRRTASFELQGFFSSNYWIHYTVIEVTKVQGSSSQKSNSSQESILGSCSFYKLSYL